MNQVGTSWLCDPGTSVGTSPGISSFVGGSDILGFSVWMVVFAFEVSMVSPKDGMSEVLTLLRRLRGFSSTASLGVGSETEAGGEGLALESEGVLVLEVSGLTCSASFSVFEVGTPWYFFRRMSTSSNDWGRFGVGAGGEATMTS